MNEEFELEVVMNEEFELDTSLDILLTTAWTLVFLKALARVPGLYFEK